MIQQSMKHKKAKGEIKSDPSRTVAGGNLTNVKVTSPAFTMMMSSMLDFDDL